MNTTAEWIDRLKDHFIQARGGPDVLQVEIIRKSMGELSENIQNEARSRVGLYDGYLTPPAVSGSIVEYDGWADLKPFLQETAERVDDWTDILVGYRQYYAQYEDRIIMFPLDGDILTLYYRKDVLKHFGLKVPRTWEEYGQVAQAIHGRVYQNQTLTGSCVGWMKGCAAAYWANLIVSSMTQAAGHWSGHLFDTENLKPLITALPVVDQALQWLEQQVLAGHEKEFESCTPLNRNAMKEGTCAMSYNWGNNFQGYLQGESVLRGKYGVAVGLAVQAKSYPE